MRFLALQVVDPPAELPVTADQFVEHGRLSGITVQKQPDLIERELTAATRRGEEFCRRSFVTQKLKALFAPGTALYPSPAVMALPRGDVGSIESIETSAGLTLDPSTYTLQWNTIVFNSTEGWPIGTPAPVFYVTWISGYGTPDDVPDTIKEGILEYATVLYDSRTGGRLVKDTRSEVTAAKGIPVGIQDIWRPFQIELSG